MNLPRIAFCGEAGAGKTKYAEAMSTLGLKRISIAEPIKVIGNEVCEAEGLPEDKVRRRPIYQAIGRAGRKINPMYWLQQLVEREHLSLSDGDLSTTGFVIDDVRFPNEADFLRTNCGFLIVKIGASWKTRRARLIERDGSFDEAALTDVTELMVKDIIADLTLINETEENLQRGIAILEQRIAHASAA